jgi:hypothetical protein
MNNSNVHNKIENLINNIQTQLKEVTFACDNRNAHDVQFVKDNLLVIDKLANDLIHRLY